MPSSERIKAAQAIVNAASTALTPDLVEELAEPLGEYMLADYDPEDWQDSGLVEALARVAALLEVDGREVPGRIMAVLRKASEAGRPIGMS